MTTGAAPHPGWRQRVPLGALLVAYVASVTCTAVSAIAVPWLVLTTTGSATHTGLVVFAEMAPYVLMQALAGPAVERIGPRRASMAGNTLAGGLLLMVPVLHAADLLRFAVLAGAVAVVGALRGAADCGSAPLVPVTARIAGTPLERAAGLHSSVSQAGVLVGAPMAGVMLSVLDPPLVLVVAGVGFVLAAVAVRFGIPRGVDAPVTAGDGRSDHGEPYLRRLRAGLAFIAGDPVLRGLVVLIAGTNLLTVAMTSVLLPSWVRGRELSVVAVGTISGAIALGGLTGSLLAAWLAPKLRRWAVFSIGFLLGSSPLHFTLAGTDAVALPVVVAFFAGVFAGGVNPVIGAVQYQRVPPAMLPRALGVIKSSAWIGVPLGPLIAGVAVESLGITATLLVFGSALLALTLGPFVVPSFRGLDDRPVATSVGDDQAV